MESLQVWPMGTRATEEQWGQRPKQEEEKDCRGVVLPLPKGCLPNRIPRTWEPADVSVRLSPPVLPNKTEQGMVAQGFIQALSVG